MVTGVPRLTRQCQPRGQEFSVALPIVPSLFFSLYFFLKALSSTRLLVMRPLVGQGG
ncbi:MAG: hypothetical protein GX870_03855 [Candidatus Marinimicrobia bacterium]|nr:hypothetical protein [Candidatus Neomarinimicrobiota bacterium]